MTKGAMTPVTPTNADFVRFVDARSRFEVTEMVNALGVAEVVMKVSAVVPIFTKSSFFVIFGAIHVRTVIVAAVSSACRSSSPLVQEMPVEARERFMRLAFA